ncbi:11262_t:CDS:2 [Cetraspora pellucida]|uniref:11262_t:CDS:1 n=1 Tax=Cetraspora pellucida TaxID=1433469 RepID=A0ACA9KG24_9GLOM|nr:11262_t:CDS:2 [Cetraspora pellucida]
MSFPPFSDAEESTATPSTASTTSTTSRKKRKANAEIAHKSNSDLVYCKICECNLAGFRQKPYPYTRKGGNTSNMISHLRDKHNITKDNYTDHLDEHNEPKCVQNKVTDYYHNMAPPCSSQRQQLIARKLIQFIIQFVQPLYILQDQSFREFVYACEPGFRIPCDKTSKGLIHEAYNWSNDQLKSLINSSVTAIHLSTNLWTAKSRHSYLGVTATWLSSDFKFREALLSCDHLACPHTGEVICEELIRLIHDWRLEATIFTVATDNRSNMVKGIKLLQETIINVERQPCAAHTLQLSVKEGLKQCKAIHRRVKSLQTFFRLPKQAQRLREAQYEYNIHDEGQNTIESPLDIIADIKTRWNSTYLAWKRVLELYNAMRFVSASLLSKQDHASQKEGENLEKLCLLVSEKEFLQDVVNLLEPIERVTRRLCGAKYPTINLVYPYMELLKKAFAPKTGETVDDYLDLIYGEEAEDDENESNESDDNIPAAGTRQQWQYAHRQFRQRMASCGRSQGRNTRTRRRSNNAELEDIDRIEYLLSVLTNGLLIRVRAAIYLLLDELWEVPTDIALVATFLDPRFKHFNWATSVERNRAQNLVKTLYDELKINLAILDDNEENL